MKKIKEFFNTNMSWKFLIPGGSFMMIGWPEQGIGGLGSIFLIFGIANLFDVGIDKAKNPVRRLLSFRIPLKKISFNKNSILGYVLVVYIFGFIPSFIYFWIETFSHGFLFFIFLGEFVAAFKALIWPIFIFI